MATTRRLLTPLFAILLLSGSTRVTLAQPGDLLVPLPPGYSQVRYAMDWCTALPGNGGSHCGPTSSAILLKWLNEYGYSAVGTWGESCCEVSEAIRDLGVEMSCTTTNGTSTTNMRNALQDILDDAYPDQFTVAYYGRVSPFPFVQKYGRNFRKTALHLDAGHLAIVNIGWYDQLDPFYSGKRCGGHYVALTGYDKVDSASGSEYWVRFRDPIHRDDVPCEISDTGVCSPRDDECIVRWRTSLVNTFLQDTGSGCDMDLVTASRWYYDRDEKPKFYCGSPFICLERLPYQDGFVVIAGVQVFSRPPVEFGFSISHDLASGASEMHSTGTRAVVTGLETHPYRLEIYNCQPGENEIFVTDLQTDVVTPLTPGTGIQLNRPQRLAFGSDGTLYVLQGDASVGFSILAIDPDGILIGQHSPIAPSDIAYHEKLGRVYAWSGSTGLLQAYTPALVPIGAAIPLPSGSTYADPGYLAVDPTGDIVYHNHGGSNEIYRFDLASGAVLTPISDVELTNPAEMAVNNRGHLYVAQGTPAPVLEFDRTGARVANSAAYDFVANTNLTITRPSRNPLLDPEEENEHNLNVDSVDLDADPPLPAASPHDARKNRYISIDTTTNREAEVAYEVKLASMKRCAGDDRRACAIDGDCPGVCNLNHDIQCTCDCTCGAAGPCVPTAPCIEHRDVGNVTKWLDVPFASLCTPLNDCHLCSGSNENCSPDDPGACDGGAGGSCEPSMWFAHLGDNPVYRAWTEDVVHIADCGVIPVITYDIRATVNGIVFSDPLTTGTITKPDVHYSDCVGPVVAGRFTAPGGITNVTEVQAYLIAFQGGPTAPHTTWVDLHGVSETICESPNVACVVPQRVLNVSDLQTIKFGFFGQTYVETPGQENPGDCPARARVASYSDSGCLDGSRSWAPDYPWCDDDSFEFTTGPGTLHTLHRNATYWCDQADIEVSASLTGNLLRLTEREIDPEPTYCLCCYDVEATVVDLPLGSYSVEYCWLDYESGWEEQCHETEIVISAARVESYSNSGCLGESRAAYPECGEDGFDFTTGPGSLHALHSNATYNCCPDDIAVSVAVEGQMIRLTEEEILTNPCHCLCCYDVEATVVDLVPGAYMVEYCWLDYESAGEEQCYTTDVVIPAPRVESYSNSGCLGESRGAYPECGEDEFDFIAGTSSLHTLHSNATYNCCPDDIVVSASVEGQMIKMIEEEVLTNGCFCLCCYNVEATVVDLSPGTYTVEYCWLDHESAGEEQCYTTDVVIPAPRLESYSNSGCLGESRGTNLGCGEDRFDFTTEPGTLHALHSDATYNCCPDDVVVSMAVEGSVITFTEEEVLTIPCDCLCCYNVESTAVDLTPGPYVVRYCWYDDGGGGQVCYETTVVVP